MERRLDALEQASPSAPTTPDTFVDPFGHASAGSAARLAGDAAADSASASLLHVTVTPTGLTIDGEALTREQARRRFESAAATVPPARLVVMAEPSVPHAAMVDVLDLAHEAGLEQVAVSARIHSPTEPPPE